MDLNGKLTEESLPLETINKQAAREKSIRDGYPSTLHLWWARRPVVAARAVLLAQLVDDPSARPEGFRRTKISAPNAQVCTRSSNASSTGGNACNEAVLAEAYSVIAKSTDDNPPSSLDPFAGAGMIPLEVQRLGLDATLEVNVEGFSAGVAYTVRESNKVLDFDKSDFEDVEW